MSVRLVLVGWGAIGRTVAGLLSSDTIELVGVGVRSDRTRPDIPSPTTVITDPFDLAALAPDVVAEAASRDAVIPWGRAALGIGADFVVSSVSALADPDAHADLRTAAVAGGAQVQIHAGALTGIDALVAARPMGINIVRHRIVKPPTAWKGTPAEGLCDLDGITEPTVFSHTSAADAARTFPKNANVAMTTALAGVGPDRTEIMLVADPSAATNRHELHAEGGFGTMDVVLANNPLPTNPKTSALAALSLVRAIENRVSPIVI
ncbi:MAG: aspartate dehydrogenase [Acidimicrobiales bacterium]